jgi:Tfp pilus assembly protein PilF
MFGQLFAEVIVVALEAGVHLSVAKVDNSVGSPSVKQGDLKLRIQDDSAAFFPHMYEIMTQIVEQTPGNIQAWFLRGVAAQSRGWHEEALMDFSQAIRLDPQHAKAYLLRSEVLASLGRYDMSRADREDALAIDPKVVQ